jgi:hypothetical protein
MSVTWTLPLVSLAFSLLAQFVLPRVLLVQMSAAEYTVFVAVTAISGYVGLSDGGSRLPILQELASLHAAGDTRRFLAAARRAARLYAVTSMVGVIVTGAIALTSLSALAREWPPATSAMFKFAVLAMIFGEGTGVATAPVHDGLLSGAGRLIASQLVLLGVVIARLSGFLVPLLMFRDLESALFGQALVTTITSCARGAHSALIYRSESHGLGTADVLDAADGLRPLHAVAVDGVLLRVAESYPVSLLPHVLSVTLPALVPILVPCRTYANGCRMLNQQFVYLLQVHITRRAAGDAASNARGKAEYEASALLMTGTQLVLVGVAAAAAKFVFALWLAGFGENPSLFLGALLAEQTLQAIVLPGSVLAVARGQIRQWGQLQLVGACASMGVYFLMMSHYPRWAFGVALFVGSFPRAACSVWWELSTKYRFARLRAGGVVVAAALAFSLQLGPLAVAAGIIAIGAATLLLGIQKAARL